jgi:hypothetical protein
VYRIGNVVFLATKHSKGISMSDDSFNRMMDTIAGFLFGLGIGMIIGEYLL